MEPEVKQEAEVDCEMKQEAKMDLNTRQAEDLDLETKQDIKETKLEEPEDESTNIQSNGNAGTVSMESSSSSAAASKVTMRKHRPSACSSIQEYTALDHSATEKKEQWRHIDLMVGAYNVTFYSFTYMSI